jgi:hypothetical protein
MKNGQKQSIVGKNGAFDKSASEGSISISPYLDHFDENSITLFGHNHPDLQYQSAPSGYEIEFTRWKDHDYTGFKNKCRKTVKKWRL